MNGIIIYRHGQQLLSTNLTFSLGVVATVLKMVDPMDDERTLYINNGGLITNIIIMVVGLQGFYTHLNSW